MHGVESEREYASDSVNGERSETPIPFRDLLLSMARAAYAVPLRASDPRVFRCVVCRKALTPRRLVLGPENLDERHDQYAIRGVKGQIAREMFGERAGEFLSETREYCS